MKAGFAAIVGRPNVGKSTLLNRLLGQKLAIVSPKPQTTRGRILGVVTRPDAQVALLDTPGLHDARGGLNARMVRDALRTLQDSDLALFLIVLMHEFGHSLACRSVGGRADRILLWPLGGAAFVKPPHRPGADSQGRTVHPRRVEGQGHLLRSGVSLRDPPARKRSNPQPGRLCRS